MLTIINVIAQGLTTNGSKVEFLLEVRSKDGGVYPFKDLNATLNFPPKVYGGETLRYPR